MSTSLSEDQPKPSHRWAIWQIDHCERCGDAFEQLKNGKKRICASCREVSGHKGGKR